MRQKIVRNCRSVFDRLEELAKLVRNTVDDQEEPVPRARHASQVGLLQHMRFPLPLRPPLTVEEQQTIPDYHQELLDTRRLAHLEESRRRLERVEALATQVQWYDKLLRDLQCP